MKPDKCLRCGKLTGIKYYWFMDKICNPCFAILRKRERRREENKYRYQQAIERLGRCLNRQDLVADVLWTNQCIDAGISPIPTARYTVDDLIWNSYKTKRTFDPKVVEPYIAKQMYVEIMDQLFAS